MTAMNCDEFMGGESRMLPALIGFLGSSRRIRHDTVLVTELPWHGRRVDLTTFTSSGVASAYELKLSNFGRVLEQALYNRLSFDRSWLVVDAVPTPANQELARKHGVGVIVAEPVPRVLVPAPQSQVDPILKRRLRTKINAVARARRSDV